MWSSLLNVNMAAFGTPDRGSQLLLAIHMKLLAVLTGLRLDLDLLLILTEEEGFEPVGNVNCWITFCTTIPFIIETSRWSMVARTGHRCLATSAWYPRHAGLV